MHAFLYEQKLRDTSHLQPYGQVIVFHYPQLVDEAQKQELWDYLSLRFARVVFLENADTAEDIRARTFGRGFNTGMVVARGDVIMVMHDDDPIHPQKTEARLGAVLR